MSYGVIGCDGDGVDCDAIGCDEKGWDGLDDLLRLIGESGTDSGPLQGCACCSGFADGLYMRDRGMWVRFVPESPVYWFDPAGGESNHDIQQSPSSLVEWKEIRMD